MRIRNTLLCLLVASVAASAAAAERRSRRLPPQDGEAYAVAVPVEFCEKMCPQDFSPCDPINFKIADARCAQVGQGR
jgi:hypothetical protein